MRVLELAAAGTTKRASPLRSDGGYEVTFYPLRSNGARADAYTLEMLRRITQETKCTFEAAPTVSALVLTMHMRASPAPERLVSPWLVGALATPSLFLFVLIYDMLCMRVQDRFKLYSANRAQANRIGASLSSTKLKYTARTRRRPSRT
eukprot:4190021-Pleurochrysis_carterae.AAC.2